MFYLSGSELHWAVYVDLSGAELHVAEMQNCMENFDHTTCVLNCEKYVTDK